MNNTISATKTQRYQITLPKSPQINNRIRSLMSRYDGMTLTEIVKLAIIELDNTKNTEMDETDYVISNPNFAMHLLNVKNKIETNQFVPAKVLSQKDIDNLC